MRYWIDTEFIDRGGDDRIYPISIGVVAEDDREYYAEFDAPLDLSSEWVWTNVVPHLSGKSQRRDEIARELNSFVSIDGRRPELWGFNSAYDWVIVCQLYGRMIDLPPTWPTFCLDVRQLAFSLGEPDLPLHEGIEHHALDDARWTRKVWQFLSAR